jgi:dihydrodipicolinate synthase/N-acetylneuraminate lyase
MAVTPFGEDGSVDEEALRTHLNRLAGARNGVYLGSPGCGEAHALTIAEHRRIFELGVEVVAGRVPVYASPRESRSAEAVLEIAREAALAGVDAIQVYQLDPGQAIVLTRSETEAYFDHVISALAPIPVLVSTSAKVGNVPGPDLLGVLKQRHPNLMGANLMGASSDTYAAVRDAMGEDASLYVNWDGLTHGLVMGAAGAVMAENNVIPRTVQRVIDGFASADLDQIGEASLLLHRFSSFVRQWPSGNARWVKAVMKLLGLGNGHVRPPYLALSGEDERRLAMMLRALDIRALEGL